MWGRHSWRRAGFQAGFSSPFPQAPPVRVGIFRATGPPVRRGARSKRAVSRFISTFLKNRTDIDGPIFFSMRPTDFQKNGTDHSVPLAFGSIPQKDSKWTERSVPFFQNTKASGFRTHLVILEVAGAVRFRPEPHLARNRRAKHRIV